MLHVASIKMGEDRKALAPICFKLEIYVPITNNRHVMSMSFEYKIILRLVTFSPSFSLE